MRDHIVLDVFRSEVSLKCGSYGHDGPPLRLTSLASLALTAPWEEGGREVCRIAVSYWRGGLLFWRSPSLLHKPPVKKAPGKTQHPHKDAHTQPERQGNDHQHAADQPPPP